MMKYLCYILTSILFVTGCSTQLPWPDMTFDNIKHTDGMRLFDPPSFYDDFNQPVDKAFMEKSRLMSFAHPQHEPLDATVIQGDIAAIEVVRVDAGGRLSPYTNDKLKIFDRCVLRTTTGQLYYTSKLGRPGPIELRKKMLPSNRFSFAAEHGKITPNGYYLSKTTAPEAVLTKGFRARVTVGGSKIIKDVVIPPDYSKLPKLDFSGGDGRDGKAGKMGRTGLGGRTGSGGGDGQDGKRSRWYGRQGFNGGNGDNGDNGGDGQVGGRGEDGISGTDGGHAQPLIISVSPVRSPFYQNDLALIVFSQNNTNVRRVIASGNQVSVVARGGNGGTGGDGGNGGRGGDGGGGGDGGSGGEGGDGTIGIAGRNGRPGRDATRTSDGTDGTDGGDGGEGGDGGDGGNGGRGGNGANGANGGDGGDGRNGGNGGNGATTTIILTGNDKFVERLKAGITVDTRGGAAGKAGTSGRSGAGGQGGRGGAGGQGGDGGRAGAGGYAGKGGKGGAPIEWHVLVPIRNPDGTISYRKEKRSRPGGRDGRAGRAGPAGDSGSNGQPGQAGANGRAGNPSNAGRDGRDGQPGGHGTVSISIE